MGFARFHLSFAAGLYWFFCGFSIFPVPPWCSHGSGNIFVPEVRSGKQQRYSSARRLNQRHQRHQRHPAKNSGTLTVERIQHRSSIKVGSNVSDIVSTCFNHVSTILAASCNIILHSSTIAYSLPKIHNDLHFHSNSSYL